LLNEDFLDLLCSANIIRGFKTGCFVRVGVSVRNSVQNEEKSQLERRIHRRDDNIKMDFKVIGEYGVYWVYMAQDGVYSRAVVDTVMNMWVVPNA